MCGEKPFPVIPLVKMPGSPPRMRGKVIRYTNFVHVDGITPAYAGKSQLWCSCSDPAWDHPRVCGEKHLFLLFFLLRLGSPPRMRGKAVLILDDVPGVGITPAYAGKSCVCGHFACICGDHPRVCGEKQPFRPSTPQVLGSPPRMRGKDCNFALPSIGIGITPAYAGKSGM